MNLKSLYIKKTEKNIKYSLINNKAHVITKFNNGVMIFILLVLLTGLAFVILYPFISKILPSFMSKSDLYDATVARVPRHWSLEHYKTILQETEFLKGFGLSLVFAVVVAGLTMMSSSFVGYGLARFRFPGSKIIVALVVLTLLVPSQTISIPLYSTFRFFDIFGFFKFFTGSAIKLTNTIWPMAMLSATCLGFRNGVFVILMRQYYIGIPKELMEAARVDGAGAFRTYFQIIFPMSKSMNIVVIALSFAWQWTDTFYTDILMGNTNLLPNVVLKFTSSGINDSNLFYNFVLANTGTIMAIIPLIIIYVFLQRKIITGIERSGIVG